MAQPKFADFHLTFTMPEDRKPVFSPLRSYDNNWAISRLDEGIDFWGRRVLGHGCASARIKLATE